MTAREVYELTTHGGASDFAEAISSCEQPGSYCLIGGLAVNCYVEPVYTLDADLVVVAGQLAAVMAQLERAGFTIETHAISVNAQRPGSDLRLQFTTDERYQGFPARAEERQVLGLVVRVACLQDVTHGKLWAYNDPQGRVSKRKKDELDLIRLGEAYPELRALYPEELLQQFKAT